MTLIAAFRSCDMPVLIGDFRITSHHKGSTRKKIERLAPNCAVGWTGHVAAAQQVLCRLRDAIGGQHLSLSSLEWLLTSQHQTDFGGLHVQLVGWLIDGEVTAAESRAICWSWDSSRPGELSGGFFQLAGSGALSAAELVGSDGNLSGQAGQWDSIDKLGTGLVLNTVATLLGNDMFPSSTECPSFGHAYEALFLTSTGFSYLAPVTYTAMTVKMDALGVKKRIHSVFNYKIFGETAVLMRHRIGSGSTTIEIIDPPGREDMPTELGNMLQRIREPGYRHDLTAPAQCLLVRFVDGVYQSPPVLLVESSSPSVENPAIAVDASGTVRVSLSDGFLVWAYQAIRDAGHGDSFVLWR